MYFSMYVDVFFLRLAVKTAVAHRLRRYRIRPDLQASLRSVVPCVRRGEPGDWTTPGSLEKAAAAAFSREQDGLDSEAQQPLCNVYLSVIGLLERKAS